jgi:hypothetical protein
LIAQAGSSAGTFTYSEADVRLGLLDIILTGDRPRIVTDFVVIGDAAGEKKSVARRSTGLDYSSSYHASVRCRLSRCHPTPRRAAQSAGSVL